MATDFNLSFKFKGSRDYVQGPDIYQAALCSLRNQGFKNMESVEFSFHKIVRSNLECRLIEGDFIVGDEDFAVKLKFQHEGSDFTVLMWEDSTAIKERYSYSEQEITDAARIDLEEKKISFDKDSEYTLIEKIVSLNKYLLSTLFSDEKGKWYFGKIEVQNDKYDLDKHVAIELKLERNLGVKYTKTSIALNGERVGFIYFSMN